MKKTIFLLFLLIAGAGQVSTAQDILEYTVKRTDTALVIDGILDETVWAEVAPTEYFVEQEHGDSVPHATQAKMLWDDHYLYIGFICEDTEIWSTMTTRDDHLWEEENVEIFGDPDGDEKNYFEMEFNPLGTIFDQLVDHSWMEGDNNEDRSWNLKGLKIGVSAKGTVNDASDTDTAWYCEVAIPFDSLDARILPSQSAPSAGDSWRIQLARYNRDRDNEGNVTGDPETSLWNMTGNPWFHVPSRFGRIIFSGEVVTTVGKILERQKEQIRWEIYPNPVSSSATISFFVPEETTVHVEILNTLGEVVDFVSSMHYARGSYQLHWNRATLLPGVYFCKLETGDGDVATVKKIILVR
jgi:hypothetical protein